MSKRSLYHPASAHGLTRQPEVPRRDQICGAGALGKALCAITTILWSSGGLLVSINVVLNSHCGVTGVPHPLNGLSWTSCMHIQPRFSSDISLPGFALDAAH
jgi:hypothetical protein